MSMMLMVKAMQTKVGNPLRKLVLIKLADNANDAGECWPSYQHVADQCEISRSTAKNHVRELEKAGLLRREYRKSGELNQSNVFHLTLDGGAGAALGGAGYAPGGGAGDDPRISHSLEPINEPKGSLSAEADHVGKSEKENKVPHQAVIDLYHKHLPMMTHIKVWSEKRKKALKARWFSGLSHPEHGGIDGLAWWDAYFAYAAKCPLLIGENDREWKADLEWLINEANMIKVIEGKYAK